MATARRIVLCLDGTWNSTYVRRQRSDEHYVLKPSNVLKIARAVAPCDPAGGAAQIVYYDVGVGSLATYPGTANALLRMSDRLLGGARGAGFEGNVEDALGFLALNHEPGDRVFVFGFSRGAATAQALTRFLDWAGGLPAKHDAYYLPALFRTYVETRGQTPCADVVAQITAERALELPPRVPLAPFVPVAIELLGVWDTVIAMGSRSRIPGRPGERSFHVGPRPARCVAHACQALAIDERRTEFRPEIWQDHHPGQRLEQRWFAGVHSNVGGGYVDDGLANLALQWMRERAEGHGLALDPDFLDFYDGYAQDRLYRSDSLMYRLWDALPGRRGRGARELTGRPASASLTLDPSVIWRLRTDPAATQGHDPPRLCHPAMGEAYRPPNVLRFLAAQPDLDAYLRELGAKTPLPDDLLAAIARQRPPG